MKSFITIALSLYSLSSIAQIANQPFQLQPGKYSYECWSVSVYSIEGEMMRSNLRSKGTTTIVKQGDSYIDYSLEQDSEGAIINSVTKTQTTKIENGLFKQVGEATTTYSFGKKTDTSNSKWEVTINSSVSTETDGHDFNVKVKNNDEDEKPAFGETAWQKLEDGRIVVQGYIREKVSTKTSSGNSMDRFVVNSTCIYKKSK